MRLDVTPSQRLNRALEADLDRMFRDILAQAGDEPPGLHLVEIFIYPRMGSTQCELTVGMTDGRRMRRTASTHERMELPGRYFQARGRGADRQWRRDITWEASREWSRMVEDHFVNRECQALYDQLMAAQAASPRDDLLVARLAYAYAQRIDHARQFHQQRGLARVQAQDLRARERRGTGRIGQESERERQRREALEFLTTVTNHMPGVEASIDYSAYADSWNVTWTTVGTVGSSKANERGMQLLKEHLTPYQLTQYEIHKFFDVKGGTTGKTYRINHGRQMNIQELDDNMKPVCGWCFLPAGGLVAGDVMLAQKNALELCEEEALKVANRFGVGDFAIGGGAYNLALYATDYLTTTRSR